MRCKSCKEKFEPKTFNRKFCYKDECINAYYDHLKKEAAKKWNKEKKIRKEKLKTVQDLLKEAQINAGHYIASGKSKFLTFNEDNVHLQCEYCNTYLHANLVDYRINLINKIGIKKVQYLEENRHKVKKFTRSELVDIIEKYKKKLKKMKNN